MLFYKITLKPEILSLSWLHFLPGYHTIFFKLLASSFLSSIAFNSDLQLPHPWPAPVSWQSCRRSLQPSLILSKIFPSPTVPQLQTSLPFTGSGFFPERSSCRRLSLSSVLFWMRSLNSRNSDLSPIRMAPTNLSL